MQFSKLAIALFAATAVAVPTGGGGGNCKGGAGLISCCKGVVGALSCVVGVCGVGGGNVMCCDIDQEGVINVNACIAV